MCKIFGLPRSTYYDRINRKPSKRSLENKKFKDLIMNIYLESKKRYGAPKITIKLKKLGHKISVKRVQRLMRELNIRSIVKKKYRHYSSNNSNFKRGKNILKRDFNASGINKKWVTDITYIHTLKDGWCYLASVMDLFTKKIVGYSFSKTMDTKITLEALNRAYKKQKPENKIIIHSDRGSQYISDIFRNKAKDLGFIQSFSSKGNPYDNSVIESFHAILKKEEVHHNKYRDYHDASLAIFQFIEGWYNRNRIHSSIDYMTPNEFEKEVKLFVSRILAYFSFFI